MSWSLATRTMRARGFAMLRGQDIWRGFATDDGRRAENGRRAYPVSHTVRLITVSVCL